MRGVRAQCARAMCVCGVRARCARAVLVPDLASRPSSSSLSGGDE
jgi:hypothetical protein